MLRTLTLFGTLSIVLTLIPTESLASQSVKPNTVKCKEMIAVEGSAVPSTLATIAITFDNDRKVTLIQFNRPRSSGLPQLNTTFSIASSKITHEIEKVSNDGKPMAETKDLYVVRAKDTQGRELVLTINDNARDGWPASSFTYESGKITYSTSEEQSSVTCDAELKVASKNTVLNTNSFKQPSL